MLPRWVTTGKPRAPAGDSWPPSSRAPTPGNNGAGGVLNYWIDGQEIGPWNDLWLRSTGDLHIGILWLNLFFHGAHGPAGVLFDDVVVSSSPIGPRSSSTPVESMGWGTMKAMFR